MLDTLGFGDFPFGEDFPCLLGVEDDPEDCLAAAFFVFVLLGIFGDPYWGRTYANWEESRKVAKTNSRALIDPPQSLAIWTKCRHFQGVPKGDQGWWEEERERDGCTKALES
eukprot:1052565-Ditylum_brightwellii.AAC.1